LRLVTPTIHFSPGGWCRARLRRDRNPLSEFLLQIPIGQKAPNRELFTKNRLKNLNRIILPSGCRCLRGASPGRRGGSGGLGGWAGGVARTCLGGQRGVGPSHPGVWLWAAEADVPMPRHIRPRAAGGAGQRVGTAAESPVNRARLCPVLQVHGALLARQRSGPGADEQLLHRAGHPHQLQHLLLRLLGLRREHGQALGEEPLLRHRRRVAGAADAVSGAPGRGKGGHPGKPCRPAVWKTGNLPEREPGPLGTGRGGRKAAVRGAGRGTRRGRGAAGV